MPESWLTPLSDDDGWTEADLQAAERRLGLRRPPAIREAYALFGRRQDLTSVQDRLLGPDRLAVDTDRRGADRSRGEPVTGRLGGAAGRHGPGRSTGGGCSQLRGRKLGTFLERFSLACVEKVLSESLFSAPLELSDNRELDPAAALVRQLFARLAMPDYPMWALPGGTVRRFVGPDVLLSDFAGTWLWVRARTTAALDAVRVALPGEWLMSPSV